MAGQYLTAVFEMRPTKRKAAILERARSQYEEVFWSMLEDRQADADAIIKEEKAGERKAATRDLVKSFFTRNTNQKKLPEPLREGLIRDISASMASYIEKNFKASSKKGKDLPKTEWPKPLEIIRTDYEQALNDLNTSSDKSQEDSARDEIYRSDRDTPPRPFILARERDVLIIRKGNAGSLAVALKIMRAKEDPKARKVTISKGINATTGEEVPESNSSQIIIIPLSCSKWHEHKFLNGKAKLKSGIIKRSGERWFLNAQFEMEEKKFDLSDKRVGIDRGVVNPIAIAVIDKDGAIIEARSPQGAEIGQAIKRNDFKRRNDMKRRGRGNSSYAKHVDQILHGLANDIVRVAKTHRATVVFENLEGLKAIIGKKRKKGSRHGGWRQVLKDIQLGKLETILRYKLELAGLGGKWELVNAANTSRRCLCCGYTAKENRETQDKFICKKCNFEAHADSVGAVNTARNGIALSKVKKGEKIETKLKNMDQVLNSLIDRGLGPLANSGRSIVADHASLDIAYDPLAGDTLSTEQKS